MIAQHVRAYNRPVQWVRAALCGSGHLGGTSDAPPPHMFRDGSLTLFRVRGVPIRAHWTLLLVIPYLAVALSYQFGTLATLAGVDHDDVALPTVVWGALLAIALFASVAVHELAHTLVAMRFGGRVRAITLMLVGGASQLSHAPKRPRHEALMALAGPATSLALGFVCLLGNMYLGGTADVQIALFYLAVVNLSLGLFNLLPAFPMDGGRVLRAILTTRLGRSRATTIASGVGKVFAIGFGIVAILEINLLLGFIAVFVYVGATNEIAAERVGEVFDELRVKDFLPSHGPLPVVGADDFIDTAIARMAALDRLELVVTDRGGAAAVIDADDVARLAPAHRHAPLGFLLSRLTARYLTVSPSASATEALETASDRSAPYLVVVDPAGAVVGLVGPQDVARTFKLRAAGAVTQPLTHRLAS